MKAKKKANESTEYDYEVGKHLRCRKMGAEKCIKPSGGLRLRTTTYGVLPASCDVCASGHLGLENSTMSLLAVH